MLFFSKDFISSCIAFSYPSQNSVLLASPKVLGGRVSFVGILASNVNLSGFLINLFSLEIVGFKILSLNFVVFGSEEIFCSFNFESLKLIPSCIAFLQNSEVLFLLSLKISVVCFLKISFGGSFISKIFSTFFSLLLSFASLLSSFKIIGEGVVCPHVLHQSWFLFPLLVHA